MIAAILLAYVGAGLFYFGRDFLQPAHNRPGYINQRQYAMMLIVVLAWMPWTVRMFWGYFSHRGFGGVWKYIASEAGLQYAVFFGLAFLLDRLLN
jgi:hypothetical protein